MNDLELKAKRRFLELIGQDYSKAEVIKKLKKEFSITDYEIKKIAKDMSRACHVITDAYEYRKITKDRNGRD